jgi:protein CpxP
MKARMDGEKRVAVILAVGVLAALLAVGIQGVQAMGRGGGLRLLMQLDLSDAQKAELRQQLPQLRAEREALQGQVDALRQRMQALMEAESFDEQAVRQAFREMAPLMEDMAVQRARFLFAVKAVLTPKQIAKVKTRRIDWQARRGVSRDLQAEMLETWLQMPAGGAPGAGQP